MSKLDIIQMMSEYYGKELKGGTIKVYLDTLDDIPEDLLELAVKRLIKTGHAFMPRVVEIRTAADALIREGYSLKDPLQLIPGAAQTEADLDERYGTIEHHEEIIAGLA